MNPRPPSDRHRPTRTGVRHLLAASSAALLTALLGSACDKYEVVSRECGETCEDSTDCVGALLCEDGICDGSECGDGSDGGSSSDGGDGSDGSDGGGCVGAGNGCGFNGECCSGICVSPDDVCADSCSSDDDCVSGCCRGLQGGGSACGPCV